MRAFMDENFLLGTDAARELYHGAAKGMPIFDYHCHLDPGQIARNAPFATVTRLMLGGDHYKWRLMRACGEDERLICGDGDDFDKFMAFARTLPKAVGNPVHHWTHLELRRVFGIDLPLTPDTAKDIYEACNALLQTPAYRPQALIDRFGVDTLCTTDDPADDLLYHRQIAAAGTLKARVLPAFRPDKALDITAPGFAAYIKRLEEAAGAAIRTASDAAAALENRVDYFAAHGAVVSDHGLETVPMGGEARYIDEEKADQALAAARNGDAPTPAQADAYRLYLLTELGAMYARRGWAQQYHLSPMRNNAARFYSQLGADTGFDAALDAPLAKALSRLLDAQDRRNLLPRTILYSLNAPSLYTLGVLAGCFQQPGVPGKMQLGAAWWFMDTKDGIASQIRTFAETGALGTCIGMLTDSRSFISYPRHEYYRRILCDLLGGWAERGECPGDMAALKQMVRDICFNNAKAYFAGGAAGKEAK